MTPNNQRISESSVFPLVDTHAHLNFLKKTEEFPDEIKFEEYGEELPDIIERAHHEGVSRIIVVGDTMADSKIAVDLAKKFPTNLSAVVGIHPHATIRSHYDSYMQELARLIETGGKGVVGIGEIGLDYSRTNYNVDPRSCDETNYKVVQEKYLFGQLELARAYNLPVSIHARDAYEDLARILQDSAWKNVRFIIHCFTAPFSVAQLFLNFGCFIGFTGIVTFPKAFEVRESVLKTPLSRIVLETDSPFLAPQAVRGSRNEPAYVSHVAREIATIKGISYEEVAMETTKNAHAFFSLHN